MSTELEIRDGQTTFDTKQLAALEQLGVARASRADQAIFFHQCVRTGLDPFARQIHMIERAGKQTIQTGIDGFRLVARRAADKAGHSLGYGKPKWCGEDGQWVGVWTAATAPTAAKVTVYRNGEAFTAVALYREFKATKRDGSVNEQWRTRPAHMIAKCAEALALRMAFPQDLSGIYTTDEIDAEDGGAPETAATSAPATSGTTRVGRTPRKAAPPKAERPKPEEPDLPGDQEQDGPPQSEELPLGVDTSTGEVAEPNPDDCEVCGAASGEAHDSDTHARVEGQ